MASKQAVVRMQRELQSLSSNSLHGIVCWPVDDNIFHLEAGKFAKRNV
jgi:ubiquitin-protein ligase